MVPTNNADAQSRGFYNVADEAQMDEDEAIHSWIEAGSPSPMVMWTMLCELPAADKPGEPPPSLSEQGMAVLPVALVRHYLGGISDEAFNRHVRPHVKVRPIGNRILVTTKSLREYIDGGSYRSLA